MSWKSEFAELTAKTHTEQGIWWLNGFWKAGAEDYKEDIWTVVHQFIECQIDGPVLYGSKKQEYKEEADLDEFKSHRILEIMGETLTVVALRKRLKELDIDNNNRMAISEYLLDKYKKTPEELVNAPQGDLDPAKLAAAQAACDAAGDALAAAQADAQAAAAAKKAAEVALEVAQAAEAEVRAAEAELQAAIAEITRLEEEKAEKIAKCQAIIDSDAGAVKKGRAVQEKEQTLAEDPLPLRKAKITQQAALRKVEKARKLAEEETAKSAAAAEAAAAAKEEADRSEKAAEQALQEALAALEELKKKGGTPMGKIWWMERVLAEKKKFMK